MLGLLQIDPWNHPACYGGGSDFTIMPWFLNHLVHVAAAKRTQGSTFGSKEHSTILSKPELKDLIDALYHKVADRWKMLGVCLQIPEGRLDNIEINRRDPCNCLLELLQTWLKLVHPPPTWAAIIDAVEFLGEEQLGRQLREKYISS